MSGGQEFKELNLRELNNKEKEDLKKDFYEIDKKEQMRAPVRFAKDNIPGLDERYYNVESAQQEILKIDELLEYRDELKLSERQGKELTLRKRRDQNFLLVNEEKWCGDSGYMRDVKHDIRVYESYLRHNVNLPVSKEDENFIKQFEEIQRLCLKAYNSCKYYVKRGKPICFWRRNRYDAVSAAMDRLKQELDELYEIEERADLIQEGDTFLDLLGSVSTRKIVSKIEENSKREDVKKEEKPKEKEEKQKKKEESPKKKEEGQKETEEKQEKKEKIRIRIEDLDKPGNEKLKKNYERRQKEKAQAKETAIKGKINNIMRDYNFAIDSKVELIEQAQRREDEKTGIASHGASRQARRTASNMAFINGYSDRTMIELYHNLKTPYDQKMEKEKKLSHVRSMEHVFDTVENFDLSRMNFTNFGELFGHKYLRNFSMAYIGMEAEFYSKEYLSIIESKDKDVKLKYDEERIKELRAKVNTLMAVSTYITGVTIVIKKLGLEGVKNFDKSMDDISKIVSEDPKLVSLINVKSELYENNGEGRQLYGPGTDVKNLYNAERQKLGLSPI
ncbi:hypothetical protein [Butyrivibrio sp. FCS014]|uniref:hypothetical protein n=1 Tax=Butyrivibrio sp. FCS014 TaxID=1408304 RepID=UPI0004645EAA|nr:hypothetical protein [Butyrivibrio sp. FCS014]